jgi:predicted ATP-dependent endonuclease of OLD family
MFIQKVTIKNFRLFPSESEFVIDEINTPDGINKGSGLNVFVGENGSGKTAILDAFALPILEYKTENFSISDLNDPENESSIEIYAKENFEVARTIKGSFQAQGFSFKAKIRARDIKAYLSSIVISDRRFIQADGESVKEDSPDLRMSVNNPWKQKRFDENDILFLDRNRIFQIRSGTNKTTRFDRLMEDFSYQYLKKTEEAIANLNDDLDEKIRKDKVDNNFLSEAIKKFQEISGSQITLDFLDNYRPFKNAFLSAKKDNNQQISISNLGAGYEMIFALLYSFYLAQQSGKQLIVLIDEPELHLHPRLQAKFVEFLLEFSKSAQIILASHSPLLVKQLSENDKVKIRVLESDGQKVSEIEKRVLSYVSANETNFLAFNLATEEYHNELYEELKSIHGVNKDYKPFDNDFFVTTKGEAKDSPWKGNQNEVSQHTFIRNQIHHQKENGKTEYSVLKASIEKMRGFF